MLMENNDKIQRPYDRHGHPLKRKRKVISKSKSVKKGVRKHRNRPELVIRYSRQYTFLKWIRVVLRWGAEHMGLTRSEVEVILYLYEKGIFRKDEFVEYCRIVSGLTTVKWKNLLNGGWIVTHRAGRRGAVGLFDLSTKTKSICFRMHRMCLGEIDIPVNTSNSLFRTKDEKSVRINKLYTNMFIKMNEERAARIAKEKEEDE